MQENFFDLSKLDDNELVLRINSGEYACFQALINRYMPLIISLSAGYKASGLDADDFIQEGILAIFSAVKTFNSEKASFKTFVTVCIKRAMSSALSRAMGAAKHIPDELIMPIDGVDIPDVNSPENILIAKESYTNLEQDIKTKLSEFEYQVLSEFLQGKSYLQIAEALSVSTKSVDNALKRIRLKIKR